MRTLKLTHEEISLIQRALGIAENQANEARERYIKLMVNVRGNEGKESIKEVDPIFNLSSQFADLNYHIKEGNRDA